MTLIEAAKQALKALESASKIMDAAAQQKQDDAIAALKQAIDHTEQHLEMVEQQEPVAWLYVEPDNPYQNVHCDDVDLSQFPHDEWFPVYKAQPKREWQRLTDQEIFDEWDRVDRYAPGDLRVRSLARAIESKCREKNNAN